MHGPWVVHFRETAPRTLSGASSFYTFGTMKTKRYRTIKVRIPVGAGLGDSLEFTDQDDLRRAYIDAVETFTASDQAFTDLGGPVVTDADSRLLSVTLTEESNDKVKEMPYTGARTVLNAGVVRQVTNMRVSWPQCRLRVNGPVAAGTDTWALVGVHFHYDGE